MDWKSTEEGWICFEGRTEASWLDLNGHVNFKRYFGLVNTATDVLMQEALTGEGAGTSSSLHFTLSARIQYSAELKADEALRVMVRPLRRTDKTVHALVRILRTDPNPGLSAECEWTGAYIDPGTRRVMPLPVAASRIFDEALGRIDAKPFEAPSFPIGYALPDVDADARLQTSSGTIPADAIDRMGHVGLEQYMYIFMISNIGFMNALGMDRNVMKAEQWGKFVLGSEIQYLAELCEGDRYRIFTHMLWVRRKTACYRHELYRVRPGEAFGTTEELLAGTCMNTMAIADLRQRKIIPLPEFMLNGLEKIYGVRIPAEAIT
jgi:acyl-CoA thioesterase FadM